MKYLNIVLVAAIAAGTPSCNRDELFEREQYKPTIAMLSDGVFNIFAEEHDLAAGDAEGYTDGFISASCGGALPTAEPVRLDLAEDAGLFHSYNTSNYASESFRYACYLPAGRYVIDSPVINIPAGGRNGRMRIRIRANGLSPDSVYLIPFRVEKCSAYELNLKKSTVLYRVYLKNFWASTKSVLQYSHRGLKSQGGELPANTMVQKHVYPVSGNEVRIFAGNKTFESKDKTIDSWAIRLSVDADGKVTIRPWSNSRFGMKVTQIDGDADYPNVFKLIDDGYGKIYRTFLLCYDYVDPDVNVTYRMKEELKIEHTKTVK